MDLLNDNPGLYRFSRVPKTHVSEFREVVTNKLCDGSYRLVEKPANQKTSPCWVNFKVVIDSITNEEVGYVQCTKTTCKAILRYTGSTTGMIKHKCSAKATPRQYVSKEDKANLIDSCVVMCAKDLHPFDTVVGEGFMEVSQELINIGAKYGRINADEVLPDPRAISKQVADIAEEVKQDIISCIKESISSQQCAMTCDLWTDNYKRLHYLTVTASYIVDSWELKSSTLFTSIIPNVPKSGQTILSEIEEHMLDFQICPQELNLVTFVTDQGYNIREQLENHKRLPCLIDCLNTSLCYILDNEFLLTEVPIIFHSVQCARKVVACIKRSGLISKLPRPLHGEFETRWNSLYMLLSSLQTQYQEVLDILQEKGRQDMLAEYNKELMAELIQFLQLFKEATDDLEVEKVPTLPLAVPWILKLQQQCEILDADSEPMQKIKERAKQFLEQKVYNELSDIHYASTFLHPSFKELLVLDPMRRVDIHELLRRMCRNVTEVDAKEDTLYSPAKKFKEWRSVDGFSGDEVDKYLKLEAPEDCKDVMMWWKTVSVSLPKLSAVAKQVLCIPASSAASERTFSRAGLIVTHRRSCIDPDDVNNLLMIHGSGNY